MPRAGWRSWVLLVALTWLAGGTAQADASAGRSGPVRVCAVDAIDGRILAGAELSLASAEGEVAAQHLRTDDSGCAEFGAASAVRLVVSVRLEKYGVLFDEPIESRASPWMIELVPASRLTRSAAR